MFKLNKNKSDKFRDQLDFKFTHFQAIQVPKGWDRLLVSLVSVETGKTITKTGKASVKNGTCRWPEAFSESIFISRENGDSKELEGNFFKFVVSMGSSRSGILGDITVNMADYASSKRASSLTLLLNKCDYSSSLQLKIQCLTPKSKHRDLRSKDTNVPDEYESPDHDDVETKLDASDGTLSRSPGSTSSNHLDSASAARASVNRRSGGRDSLEPNGHLKEPNSSVTSLSSRSSKDLIEAGENTIKVLRAEARMWEQNSKKLVVDVDSLKNELSVQSRKQKTLSMELSASNQECSSLKQEIKHLKILLEETAQKQNTEEDMKLQAKDADKAQHDMDEEIRFLKESNDNLTEQLQKSQESNLELLNILQELEGIVETQKSEIQTLSSQRLKSEESTTSGFSNDSRSEEINNIRLQLEQLHEIQEELEGYIQDLEKTIDQKDNEIETERELRMDLESKWKMKIAGKEGGVSETDKEPHIDNAASSMQSNAYANGRTSEVEGLEEDTLRQQLSTLENQISSLRDENHLLEESLEREKNISSESLEEEKKKIVNLERLSSELEKGKEEIEQQLSELEKENMQLTERISALEPQLRCLMNEKETFQLELRVSNAQIINLRDEIKILHTDIESQKVDMKQKLDDLQKRWLEAQEECEYLKEANPKLEATTEKLIEEYNSLQKYNVELKRQNMDLVTRYSATESQLRESTAKYSDCSRKVEAMETEFSAMAEQFSVKEKCLKSELDYLINADREYKEKLMQENTSLNNMYSQKVVEVEKIQSELVHFIDQISVAQSEHASSDIILELSSLRTEKAKLEASLQQQEKQFLVSESKLGDYEAKVQELTKELKASKQKHEALTADHAKVLKLLENLKSNEAKHKTTIGDLEKNLKSYKYERLQQAEEISNLKEQVQRATLLQGEIVTLKTSLNNAKFESQKANASFEFLRGEHEILKIKKDSLAQKVLNMEKSLLQIEECERSKITLEDKLLRLEGDLAAREALCVQDAEIKYELNKVKRANSKLHRKIKHLEQDQEENLKKVKALQGQLKRKNRGGIEDGVNSLNDSEIDNESTATTTSKDENQPIGRSIDTDYASKIEALENDLAEAVEANEMYKSQLKRFLYEEQNAGNPDKSKNGVDVAALQTELRELRDKYFEMSLNYAEVEAQRQELVLKLKSAATTNKKRWF